MRIPEGDGPEGGGGGGGRLKRGENIDWKHRFKWAASVTLSGRRREREERGGSVCPFILEADVSPGWDGRVSFSCLVLREKDHRGTGGR